MQPEEVKRGLLRTVINKHKKQMTKDDVQDIVTKHSIDKYSKELLTSELGDFEDDHIIEKILDQLKNSGMWEEHSKQLPTYSKFELDGLTEDYRRLLISTESGQLFVEMQLQKCLLIVFKLKHQIPNDAFSIPEIQMDVDEKIFKEELLLLERIIKEENRLLGNTKVLVERLIRENNQTNSQSGPYEILQSLKKELKVLDANELHRLIDKACKAGETIRSQKSDIVVFIGDTGSGKTTMIKSLSGYKMGRTLSKGLETVDVIEQVNDPVVREMYCNPGCKSVTRYVVVTKPKENVTSENVILADTPGFQDTAGIEVEFANIIGMKKALQQARNMRIVIIIGPDSWGSRYNGIRQLSRVVAMLFSNYKNIKDSVTIMFNKQSPKDVKEKGKMFKQILASSPASDKNDDNYSSFIKHLNQVASQEDEDGNPLYVIYDPLSNKPKLVMERLLKTDPIKNAYGVFSDRTPSGTVVKNYCTEIEKRVKYHLEGNRLLTVKYFIEELQRLSEDIESEMCETELNKIRQLVIDAVKDQQQAVKKNFNNKVKALTVREEDCSAYFEEVERMKKVDFSWLLIENNYQQQAEANIKLQMQSLITKLEQEEDTEKHKIVETIRTVYLAHPQLHGPVYEEILSKFNEEKIQLLKEYELKLQNAENVSKIGLLYERMKNVSIIFAKLKQKRTEKREELIQSNLQKFESKILSHISKKESRVDILVININEKSIEELSEIDKYLSAVKDNHTLLRAFSHPTCDQVRNAPKQLKSKLIILCDERIKKMNELIHAARKDKLDRCHATGFNQQFSELVLLGRVECISDKVESERIGLERSVLYLIDEQSRTLHHFKEMTGKDKSDIMKDVRSLDSSINIIEQIVKSFSKETADKGREILKEIVDNLEKQLPLLIKKMFKVKIVDSISQEELEKVEEACELERFFKRKRERYQEHFKIISQVNRQNGSMLMQTLTKGLKSLILLEESNEHFANTPKEAFSKYASFRSVEKFLQFINALNHSECKGNFEGLRTKVNECESKAEEILRLYKESIQTCLKMFIEQFMDRKANNTYVLYQAVYSNLQRKLKDLTDIQNLPHVSRTIGGYKQFQDSLSNQLNDFVEDFTRQFDSPKDVDEAKLVVEKCQCLPKTSNKSFFGDVVNMMLEVKKKAEDKIDKSVKRVELNLQKSLKQKQYFGLKGSIKIFKEIHGSDHQTIEQLTEQVKDMAFALENEIKQEWKSQQPNLERMLEQTLELLGLAELQTELNFSIPPKLLTSQREALVKRIEKLIKPLRNLSEEGLSQSFGNALIALDQLLGCNLDAHIKEFLKEQLNPVEIDELNQNFFNYSKSIEQKYKSGLTDNEFRAYSEYFGEQRNVFDGKLYQRHREMLVNWKQYCEDRAKEEIDNAQNQPSSRKREEALHNLSRQIGNYPRRLQEELKQNIEALLKDVRSNLEKQRRRIRSLVPQISEEYNSESFKKCLRFIENEGDDDLETELHDTLKNILQRPQKLSAYQFLRFYRQKLVKLFNAGSHNGADGQIKERCTELIKKSSDILSNKLANLNEQFYHFCRELEQHQQSRTLKDETANLISQGLEQILLCVGGCLRIVEDEETPDQKSDIMGSSVEGSFKEIAKCMGQLLELFDESLSEYRRTKTQRNQVVRKLQPLFHINKILKNLEQDLKALFAEPKSSAIKEQVVLLQTLFLKTLQDYNHIEDQILEDTEKAILSVRSMKFDSMSLQDQQLSQIKSNMAEYVKTMQLIHTSLLPLCNLIQREIVFEEDATKVSIGFTEMRRACHRKIEQLERPHCISDYSFLEVLRMLSYLNIYEEAMQTSKYAKESEITLYRLVNSFIEDMKSSISKPRQEGLLQLARYLVRLKTIDMELPAEITQECNDIILSYLRFIPMSMMDKLKGHIASTKHIYCHRILSYCQINEKTANLQLEDCKPFLSKMPKQFSNFEIVYNRCREAFNTELADFRKEKIDKEELDQLRKNLPTKIQTKAKQIRKHMDARKPTNGYELLGMVLAMQTICNSYQSADNYFVTTFWPECTEILTMLLLLGLYDSKDTALRNCLARLLPGEQNSHLITSIVATYLALIGYHVHILNNSSVANNVNKQFYNKLHTQLSVGDRVYYGTVGQILAHIYQEDCPLIQQEVKHIIKSNNHKVRKPNPAKQRILLFDEVATFFDQQYHGKVVQLVTSVDRSLISELMLIDYQKHFTESPEIARQKSQRFPGVEPSFPRKKSESPHKRPVEFPDFKEDSDKQLSGWYSYLSKALEMSGESEPKVVFGVVPAEFIHLYYHFIIGLTFTYDELTEDERTLLKDKHKPEKMYDMPTKRASGKPKSCGMKLFSVQEHAQAIMSAIEDRGNQGGTLVCFDSEEDVHSFSRKTLGKSNQFAIRLLTEGSHQEVVINPNEVILTSRKVSKGVQFKLLDDSAEASKTLHVIITFQPYSLSEAAILENHSICNGVAGSYKYILATAEPADSNGKINKGSDPILREKAMKENVRISYRENLQQTINMTQRFKQLHEVGIKFLDNLSKNRINEARFNLKAMNYASFRRIVIAIEGSAHMSEVFANTPDVFKEFGNQLAGLLPGLQPSIRISLQILSYTNYNCSPKNILNYSEVSSAQQLYNFSCDISPEGSEQSQAFELVMQHSLEQYADQIVVIAASPGNNAKRIDELYKTDSFGLKEKPFKKIKPEDLIGELVKHGIAVKCLYVGSKKYPYFGDLAKKTNGTYLESLKVSEFLTKTVIDYIKAQAKNLEQGTIPTIRIDSTAGASKKLELD